MRTAWAAHASSLPLLVAKQTQPPTRPQYSEQQGLQWPRAVEVRPTALTGAHSSLGAALDASGSQDRCTEVRGAAAELRSAARRHRRRPPACPPCSATPAPICLHPQSLQAAVSSAFMATLDDVPALLARLRSRSRVQQAAAARALSELAGKGADGCSAIAAAGGISVLAEALRSSTAAVQQHAAMALMQLPFSSAEQRAAVAASGVIKTMAQLMQQPGAVGEAAAGTMCCLLADMEAAQPCAAFIAAGGLPALVSVLKHGTPGAQHSAALAMHYIAKCDSCYPAALPQPALYPRSFRCWPMAMLTSRGAPCWPS